MSCGIKEVNTLKSFFVFMSVGALTAAVNFSLVLLFVSVIKIPYVIAISLAFILAALLQFFLNKNITFKRGHQKRLFLTAFRYFIMLICNYLVYFCSTVVLIEIVALDLIFALFFATCFTAIFGFIVSKIWVFQ